MENNGYCYSCGFEGTLNEDDSCPRCGNVEVEIEYDYFDDSDSDDKDIYYSKENYNDDTFDEQ